MKNLRLLLFFAAVCSFTASVYAQLSNGSQYRIFSEADPAHGLYYTNTVASPNFQWGNNVESGVFLTANHNADWADDVWQFEYATGAYIRTAGGGLTACAYSGNQAGEMSNRWKLIPDGTPVGNIQYYLLKNLQNSANRHMYFQESDKKVYTNEVTPPADDTRKYYRIGFELNASPVLNISTASLAFSTGFLSKNVTITGENIAADITFTVPAGITLSGTNVVNSAGNYSIAAANANGTNTVTITANSDEGIDGTLTASSTGATSRSIVLKSGIKQDVWYNIKLFHATEQLYIDADAASPSLPAVQSLNTANPVQYFTFIPVLGKDETFNIKNAAGDYLVGNADGTAVYQSVLAGDASDEWTTDLRNGSTVLDYFTEFTLKVGSRPSPNYLALSAGTAAGVSLVCNKTKDDPRGTWILKTTTYNTTGIKDISAKTSVFAANRQIVVSASQPVSVRVYNLAGQKVAEKALDKAKSICVPNVGIYLVSIRGNSISETHKVILK
jgi:hypothetical protein